MDSDEISFNAVPYFVIYKDGRIDRLLGEDFHPPGVDPKTGVESKDVVVSPEDSVAVRIYRPKSVAKQARKLPLLVYFHGGGFCVGTAFSSLFHQHINAWVAKANIAAVSVDYRRAPEYQLPIPFEDSWTAMKWVAAHSGGAGPDEWLNEIADLNRVYLGGDSAGGNIAHRMALRVATEGLAGVKIKGLQLVHPHFWGEKLIGEEKEWDPKDIFVGKNLWFVVSKDIKDLDDPIVNPEYDPDLERLSAEKVAVYVAEKDNLKERGRHYAECLRKSGWGGAVEVVETIGEGHVFHLFNPTSDSAVELVGQLAAFTSSDCRG
ncbi:probable carboxylesterase 12 [Cucurbita moschata]|uniref:Probable carboxylesterase 12 n=1 Tax=Cucurbita moschata TaxID=3662 RepID=A0A6J1FV58_CUCMO|nr:probable carboxylesterase 12 [Cucurbita moschata]